MTIIPHNKWDNRFMELAAHVATWSKDPSTQCGAVIARTNNTIASVGYNGFPRGMKDDPELYDIRDAKYSRIIHSEMNAILNAAEPVNGFTLYTYPFLPCDRCAVHVVQAGIAKVVSNHLPRDKEARWKEMVDRSVLYFNEAGVEVVLL